MKGRGNFRREGGMDGGRGAREGGLILCDANY